MEPKFRSILPEAVPDVTLVPLIVTVELESATVGVTVIDEIEFSNDTNYKGYWESRGYSKEGNLNASEFS